MWRRCRSPNTMTLSKQSHLIEPISRSAYPFCQGDRAAVGRLGIHRRDAVSMITQECPPALGRRPLSASPCIWHCGLTDIDAELEELAVNARCAPSINRFAVAGQPHWVCGRDTGHKAVVGAICVK